MVLRSSPCRRSYTPNATLHVVRKSGSEYQPHLTQPPRQLPRQQPTTTTDNRQQQPSAPHNLPYTSPPPPPHYPRISYHEQESHAHGNLRDGPRTSVRLNRARAGKGNGWEDDALLLPALLLLSTPLWGVFGYLNGREYGDRECAFLSPTRCVCLGR